MPPRAKAVFALVLGAAVALGLSVAPAQSQQAPGLTAFRNQAALDLFLRQLRDEQRQRRNAVPIDNVPPPPPPPPPGAATESAVPPAVAVTGARTAPADGITNNQVAGVDEGGIVKARGDLLIVLRRGRLFTVSTANDGNRPVATINAFAPGADGRGDWYDEMLVSGEWVVVIGYSYARQGTQVNRFRLGGDGSIRFVDAHSFRSDDYYSSRNYASRLVGNRLVLYAPIPLDLDRPSESFPVMRRWNETTKRPIIRPLSRATHVFVPERVRRLGTDAISTVHSVTNCDLTAEVLDCTATSVLGGEGRTFFVSGNAVYVWTALRSENDDGRAAQPVVNAILYRLPFDDSRPQAVAARGQPIDQFSFLADSKRAALHVMVTPDGDGDRMWGPEFAGGAPALVTIATGLFGSGAQAVPRNRYQPLPKVSDRWSIQNRFVGDHLLYAGSGGAARTVNVVSLATRVVTPVAVPHGISRLDAIGPDAIAIGEGQRFLGFSAIDLRAPTPRVAAEYRLPDAGEGESRSHALFFRPDPADRAGQSGLLGLPVARNRRGPRGFEPSTAIVFLRRDGRALETNGELAASEMGRPDDACRASCVDWYGNARPIFHRDRIFALLGYELVEGRATQGGMAEIGRSDMARLVNTRPR